MMLKFKYPLLFVLLSLLLGACEKEYSVEGNVIQGSAIFSFAGSPGPCTSTVVTGDYKPGVALDATNIATVSVDVTSIGTYSVTTDVVNGFSFSGSGTFTTTGLQTITLTASGIPGAAGQFTFAPGANTCAFSVTVSNGGGSGAATFSYNGSPATCTNAVPAGTYTAGTALTSANTITIGVVVSVLGTWSITTPVVNGISFSGSGSFASIGAQTVKLTGSGTPTADGVFNFTPSNNGCEFPITVTPAIPAGDFLQCTIDGTPRTFNVELTGQSAMPSTFAITGNETAAPDAPHLELDLTRSPAITTGTYDKFSATNLSTFSIANYTDAASATPWTIGPTQTGPFTVTITSFSATRIEGTFSGTLYDNSGLGTNTKVITDGQFSLPY